MSATALALIAGSSEIAAQTTPPAFTASPFSAEFVIVGTQDGVGLQYVPAHGDGTFGAPTDVPGLSWVFGVDVADMDGDQDLDFLAADGLSGAVYLYRNQGGGVFAPRRIAVVPISFRGTTSLRVADFNRDGRPDLVIGDAFVAGGARVSLQNPAGRFHPGDRLDVRWNDGPSTTGSAGDSPLIFAIAVGDIDGDGRADIMLVGEQGEGAGEVRVYRGQRNGHLGGPELLFDVEDAFGVNPIVTGAAAFDLDSDGDLDLVLGAGGGRILIYTNDGSGRFTAPVAPAVTVENQTGIDAYDADGDGDHDLMIQASGSQILYFVENRGGVLAPPIIAATVAGFGIAVGAPPLSVR